MGGKQSITQELEQMLAEYQQKLRPEESMTTGNEWTEDAEEGAMRGTVDGRNGYHAVVEREQQERREQFRRGVEIYLKNEPELAGVFGCQWEGLTNPAEIGRRLGMDERAVKSARKRLDRRLAAWRKSKGSG